MRPLLADMFFLCSHSDRAVNAEQVDTYQLKSLDGQFGKVLW